MSGRRSVEVSGALRCLEIRGGEGRDKVRLWMHGLLVCSGFLDVTLVECLSVLCSLFFLPLCDPLALACLS